MVWLCLGVAGRKRDPGHGQLWCSWAAPSLSQHSTSSPGELSPGIYLEWRKNRHTESNGMLVSFSSTTNGHHHSIGVIENLVLLCWGSCTTRAKRSVSRIWKSNPKLSDMWTWEQENEETHTWIGRCWMCVTRSGVQLTCLKGLQTTLEMGSESLTFPEDTEDRMVSVVTTLCAQL